MMGVTTAERGDRGWASLCAGVIKNEPITRYGKWYGPGYWGGGDDADKAGLDAPVDSLDEVAQRHDYGYLVAEKYGKIYGKQYEYKLKAMADKVAVRDAMKLPEDPSQWEKVPADIEAAKRYHDRIITGFILESDIYKNLADATKVGDVVTSPFITMFDQIDYSHVPDLEKFDREVASYINGWKKDVAKHAEEDKKIKEMADKRKADQEKEFKEAELKEQADKERAAREKAEAEAAKKRLEEKIKDSKKEPEEKPEADADKKKSYADMTPEERREALKNNDPEAWEAVKAGLTGEDKQADADKPDAEDEADAANPPPSDADAEITPVKVTASGSLDGDYSAGGFTNIVTTTITVSFWNVGSQVPGYGEASLKRRSVASLNGVSEEESCGGTFSGGPNGVLSFSGACAGTKLSLRGGSSISAEGVTLSVSNPDAFSAWEK
jgi:chemotaxis protein histidine kinase CheA